MRGLADVAHAGGEIGRADEHGVDALDVGNRLERVDAGEVSSCTITPMFWLAVWK